MATVNLDNFEELVRSTLKNAVDTFGFGGVLSLLADEASERIADDQDDLQGILDAIETAVEEVSEHEEPADETGDDSDEEFEQDDYIVTDDEEESDDDGDYEED